MTRWWVLPLLAVVGLGWSPAGAERLALGPPLVESDDYYVPVMLTGDAGVAAMDFRLRYDPAVLEPVGTTVGPAAAAAGKQVAANTAAPGEHIVVVMGLNQTVMRPGEVANVLFRRVGSAGSAQTRIDFGDLAMSTPDGVEIPAQGVGRDIALDGDDAPERPPAPNPDGGSRPAPTPAPGAPRPPAQGDAPARPGPGPAWVWEPEEGEGGGGDEGEWDAAVLAEALMPGVTDGGAEGTALTAEGAAALQALQAMLDAESAAANPVDRDARVARATDATPPTGHETNRTNAPVPNADRIEPAALAALPVESPVERNEPAAPAAAPSGAAPMAALAGLVGLALALGALVALRARLFR